MGESFDIAIIGGGYTGAVLALHLLRRARAGARIAVIEPRADVGSGVAYATPDEQHRINVPADRMGVSAAPQDRFDIWLKTQHPELIGDGDPERTYVPRRWFGIFVRDRLAEAIRTSAAVFRHIQAEATSVRTAEGGAEIALSDGRKLRARHVVVAVSHGLPALPRGIPATLVGTPGFLENPWNVERLREIPRDGAVLIIGTGLTMADVIASLLARGHRGPITAISRHGLLPRKSGPASVPPGLDLSAWPSASVAHYVKSIRAEMDRVEAEGLSWRGVFTALRVQSGYLWSRLTHADKHRFLRHLKTFYDVHRYRMAPETYELIEAAESRGQVRILAAHVIGVERTAQGFDVAFRRRGAAADETLRVAGIVNCTGPKQKLSADPTNFLGGLIAAGIAEADPLGLGLAVDGDFRVVGNATNFYALGPLTRERFGDTYGAPEIEVQAGRLATQLAAVLTQENAAV
ncbi:MAG: FAD-dependent oxidoreductase [Methylovirgula sp.]|uniref:FAD/NAD(P)-binding protein n=1 Tax=Methylovirgula sp. TaxID=1978224 RepID=UPI0030761132